MMAIMGDEQTTDDRPIFELLKLNRDGTQLSAEQARARLDMFKGKRDHLLIIEADVSDDEFRPNEPVFAREALDTLIGKPVTDER